MIKLKTGNYYGSSVRKTNLNGLFLNETMYRKNSSLPAHEHENIFFCFVLTGSFLENYSNKQRTCKQGTLLFHPKYEKHADNFGQSDTKCFNIELNENWFKELSYKKDLLNNPIQFDKGEYSKTLFKIYKNFVEFDDVSELAIHGNLLNILAELIRIKSPSGKTAPQWLTRVKERINDSPADNINISELSKIANVHPVHLTRTFKACFDCSPGEYLRKIRIQKSVSLLINTTLSLSEISLSCGFSDQSHFSNIFKKFTGFTPGEYRKNIKIC